MKRMTIFPKALFLMPLISLFTACDSDDWIEPEPVPEEGEEVLFFSPAWAQLARYDFETGTVSEVFDEGDFHSFTEDGTEVIYNIPEISDVYYGYDQEIFIRNTESGELLSNFTLENLHIHNGPAQLSPDGNILAVVNHYYDDPGYPELRLYKTDGELIAAYERVKEVAWCPDGSLVLIEDIEDQFRLSIASAEELGKADMELEVITQFDEIYSNRLPQRMAISPDGSKVAYSYNDNKAEYPRGLYVQDLEQGVEPQKIDEGDNDYVFSAGWSPDGSRLAAHWRDNLNDPGEIHLIPYEEGGSPVQLGDETRLLDTDGQPVEINIHPGSATPIGWFDNL